jgi:hypothetical protein
MQTYTGLAFDVLDPAPESIRIEDIAHALALTNRYGGHTPAPYSVAQHSVQVSILAGRCAGEDSVRAAQYGLLHDASEAYLGDMKGPIKRLPHLDGYRQIEGALQARIYQRFGLEGEPPAIIKWADLSLLVVEADRFFPEASRPFSWELPALSHGGLDVEPWPWQEAEAIFLERFHLLVDDRAAGSAA